MADNPVQSQEIRTFKNYHYVLGQFHYGASGDTVKVPRGCLSAAVLVRSGTAPTVSISAGAPSVGYDTVTLSGGTENNSDAVIVSRHGGNPASLV